MFIFCQIFGKKFHLLVQLLPDEEIAIFFPTDYKKGAHNERVILHICTTFFFEFCRQIIKEMRQFLFVNNQEAKEEEEKKDMT